MLEVLKGTLAPAQLRFNGGLSPNDDLNGNEVPYRFVRPGGRGGNCFALEYRQGAEYLLLLRTGDHPSFAQAQQLTPYWAPLGPTNEQVLGGTADPWVTWVRRRVRTRSGG